MRRFWFWLTHSHEYVWRYVPTYEGGEYQFRCRTCGKKL